MIEQIVRDYLEEQLGIPVRMEEEAGLPEEYIVVEKTGSGQTNHIKRATLAVQSLRTWKFSPYHLLTC